MEGMEWLRKIIGDKCEKDVIELVRLAEIGRAAEAVFNSGGEMVNMGDLGWFVMANLEESAEKMQFIASDAEDLLDWYSLYCEEME